MAFGTDRLSRGRARVEQRLDGLHVRIPARRHWFVLAFLCVWLTLFVLIATPAFTGGERVEEDGAAIAVIGGLILLIGALSAIAFVMWSLIGCEEIEDVGNAPRGAFAPYMLGSGSIAFDYGHRTHDVGLELDDAKHLARLIGDAVA